ncbi:glycine oxidase ThiO [Tumebacillus algifaecis]|uniref:glycine oxidase n=1 Tax=Tumebacillus algifaecis TaxID=1214604 RepID=A0A223D3C1_9BACL|nr:glycine oxidase ThiO [Tumebacillus algifaecis]ASS76148.1 glycine oxidase ThiO [Tumebacillus algifaecis]
MIGTSYQTDTLIVGGGVIGCAIAYELAKAGVQVTVLEKDTLGSQSTRAGAGMLGAQVEMTKPDPMFDLSIQSRALFPKLREELLELSGIDMELHTSGIFRIAVDEADRAALLDRQSWQTEAGQRAVWFEDEELRGELGDILSPTYGALYLPDDHQVRNPQLLLALAASSKRLGARFLEHSAMVCFLQDNGAIVGVKTVDSEIRADRVILAAGAWSGLIANQLGLELPVFPVKGQSFLLDSYSPPTPFTIYTHGCYILPKRNGQVYVGATEETRSGFDRRPNLRSLATLSSQAVQLLPSLGDLPFSTPLAGLRPGSLDGLPFLGSVPGIAGLYVATGHFRNGVLLSAITGRLIAELLTGKTPSVDLEPFSLSRLQHS